MTGIVYLRMAWRAANYRHACVALAASGVALLFTAGLAKLSLMASLCFLSSGVGLLVVALIIVGVKGARADRVGAPVEVIPKRHCPRTAHQLVLE